MKSFYIKLEIEGTNPMLLDGTLYNLFENLDPICSHKAKFTFTNGSTKEKIVDPKNLLA